MRKVKAEIPADLFVAPEIDPTLATKQKKSTIIGPKTSKPKAAKSAHYVDNEEFFRRLVMWQNDCAAAEELGNPLPKPPDYIGECVLKICNRLSSLYYFSQYTYREELVLNAVENCVKKLRSFNPKKTQNPFAYFTQCAYYNFLGTILEEKKEAYSKYKLILDRLSSSELAENSEDQGIVADHAMDNVELQTDHLQKYVSDFELKHKIGAAHRKAKGRKKKVVSDSTLLE